MASAFFSDTFCFNSTLPGATIVTARRGTTDGRSATVIVARAHRRTLENLPMPQSLFFKPMDVEVLRAVGRRPPDAFCCRRAPPTGAKAKRETPPGMLRIFCKRTHSCETKRAATRSQTQRRQRWRRTGH
jgi:hypothetical protein